MDVHDYSVKVGGEAGQGINTIASILSRSFADQGLYLFAYQDYYSRVRGGHNFYQVRTANYPVYTFSDSLEVLVALDKASLDLHAGELNPGGVIIYDQAIEVEAPGDNALPLPMAELGKEHGGKEVMGNSVAAGATWQIMGGDQSILEQTLGRMFKKKGNAVAEANIKAARSGIDYAAKNFSGQCRCRLQKGERNQSLVLTGNEALALGALAAGCRFISSYPMTPASGVMQYMARQTHRLPLAYEQAEDEIAAINMSIGAANAGARAMVATSGGGFSLMVEGLSLAGMNETPLVIVLGQRPGPATGMATRTEQGDLLFAMHAGSGEFPRAILAPRTVEEAFWMATHAFNIAEKYQVPVFLMSDQHLADTYYTVDPFNLNEVIIDRGLVMTEDELSQMDNYERYKNTESGISPRAFMGQGSKCVMVPGNEHTENGYSTEDPVVRTTMQDKRMRKHKALAEEVKAPDSYGTDNPDTLLLTWGSSYGACREAVDKANRQGEKWQVVSFPQLWPFPGKEALELIEKAGKVISVEMNSTGQLGRLLRVETGKQPDMAILKYDGRPMNATYVLTQIENGGVNPWM